MKLDADDIKEILESDYLDIGKIKIIDLRRCL